MLCDPKALERIAAAADLGLDHQPPRQAADWLRLGGQLGLEGLVPALVQADRLQADRSVLRQAVGQAMAAEAEQAPLLQAALDGLQALARAGISAVPLKGPLLAARLYPQPLVRRSSDVDLLVARRDLQPALGVLQRLGYVDSSPAKNTADLRHHHHITLVGPARVALELHFNALHAFGAIMPGEELLQGAQMATVALPHGQWTGLLLDPADELLYLAGHAAAHNFERPLWTLDIGLLAAQTRAIDWPALWLRAQRWHLQRPIVQALRTAARQLGDQELLAQLPPATAWERNLELARDRLRPMPRKSIRRYALDRACLLAGCQDPWRATWLAQYTWLRALGDLGERAGLQLPASWPPLPPLPPELGRRKLRESKA